MIDDAGVQTSTRSQSWLVAWAFGWATHGWPGTSGAKPHRPRRDAQNNPVSAVIRESGGSGAGGWTCRFPDRCPAHSVLNQCLPSRPALFQTDPRCGCFFIQITPFQISVADISTNAHSGSSGKGGEALAQVAPNIFLHLNHRQPPYLVANPVRKRFLELRNHTTTPRPDEWPLFTLPPMLAPDNQLRARCRHPQTRYPLFRILQWLTARHSTCRVAAQQDAAHADATRDQTGWTRELGRHYQSGAVPTVPLAAIIPAGPPTRGVDNFHGDYMNK